MSDKVREQFEAWAKEYGMLLAHDRADVALTWATWQASRAAALEEAAAMADAHLDQADSRAASYALEELAEDIRALGGAK